MISEPWTTKKSCASDPAALVAEDLYSGRLFDLGDALAARPRLTENEWRRALPIVIELRAAEAAEQAASSAHFDQLNLDRLPRKKAVPESESLLRRIGNVLSRMHFRQGG